MHLDKRTDHGLGPILILSDLLIFLFHLSLSTAVPLRLLRAVCRTPPFHGTEVLARRRFPWRTKHQFDMVRSRYKGENGTMRTALWAGIANNLVAIASKMAGARR